MVGAHLRTGGETDRLQRGKMLWQQVEVRHVHTTHQARADLREAVPPQALPPIGSLPPPVLEHVMQGAHGAEDRSCGGKPRIEAVARRDADLDGLEILEGACKLSDDR